MNRRGFFGTIGKVAAGFMILPGAGRVWGAVIDPRTIPNPDWNPVDYQGEWRYETATWDESLGLFVIKSVPAAVYWDQSPFMDQSSSA